LTESTFQNNQRSKGTNVGIGSRNCFGRIRTMLDNATPEEILEYLVHSDGQTNDDKMIQTAEPATKSKAQPHARTRMLTSDSGSPPLFSFSLDRYLLIVIFFFSFYHNKKQRGNFRSMEKPTLLRASHLLSIARPPSVFDHSTIVFNLPYGRLKTTRIYTSSLVDSHSVAQPYSSSEKI